MDPKIIKTQFLSDIDNVKNIEDLSQLKQKYLGRSGQINKAFDSLDKTSKAKFGKDLNLLKQEISSTIDQTLSDFSTTISKTDYTVPPKQLPTGHLHLVTQAINEIEDIFQKIGFARRRYNEVETDWYYAEGLNIPKDHPGRDDQETFYLSEDVVLTAHTSNGQLREMELIKKPPIKMINISKTYRRQSDVSHTPMFHQFEGLMIDKDINICNLIAVSNYFVKAYFGENRQIRLRPHHFQFTEPSFEIDINCGYCFGKGCRLCKAGWLELGGAGMVHPVVLKNGGINPDKYSGFAFGWGVERVLMMKPNLNLGDLRNIYSNDLRILKQF